MCWDGIFLDAITIPCCVSVAVSLGWHFIYAAISDASAVAAGCPYLSWLHVKHLFDHFGSSFLLSWRVMDVVEHLGFVLLEIQESVPLFQERQCKDNSRECGPRGAELFATFSFSHPALLPWPFQQVPSAGCFFPSC